MPDRLDFTSAKLFREAVEKASIKAGMARIGEIPGALGFRQWCEELGRNGLKVDRKPFTLENRQALVPIYDAIPSTREEACGRRLVIQKATQLGLTVWEVLADIYMAKKWAPVNIGLYLPSQSLASNKSNQRFMPIIASHAPLLQSLTHRETEDGLEERIGQGNILTREFAGSLLQFLWTSGQVTTESFPFDVVSLDEVQGMELQQIDKVLARMGDSTVDFAVLLSTAFMAELDINEWYLRGTQEVWHTECQSCGVFSDLSDPATNFPKRSIAYNVGEIQSVPENEYYWRCPECGAPIADPQVGQYIAQNMRPEHNVRSFLLPRTISPRITPRKMVTDYHRAKTGAQRQSFYNRTLARPYSDPDTLPVALQHCEAAAAAGMAAGIVWKTSARDTCMGIDHMGGWNAVVIKERLASGRQAVIHVEAVYGIEPFERCSGLMEQYGVTACVVENLPNFNSARAFANRHRGRVFIASYANLRDDTMVWGDDLSRSDRRTAVDDRSRYTVSINQYKAMQTTLHRIRDGHCWFPDPAALVQDVIEGDLTRRVMLLRDLVFLHYTKTALVIVQHPDTRKPVAKVQKLGLDPHFSFATMLCDVAWARSYGNGTMILPDAPDAIQRGSTAEKVERAMPGLPKQVLGMLNDRVEGTCGACSSYREGQCVFRGLGVGKADPACVAYVAAGS